MPVPVSHMKTIRYDPLIRNIHSSLLSQIIIDPFITFLVCINSLTNKKGRGFLLVRPVVCCWSPQ